LTAWQTRHAVHEVLDDVIAAHRLLAEANGFTLTQTEEPGCADVSCDHERILQVLGNLIGNAMKFTPCGTTIQVVAAPVEDKVRFSVIDHGPGIPAEQLPYLFGRYWKGEAHSPDGVGLGLYICKGIVEAHGGDIWVESTVGVGTTFSFTLPLATDDART
jgi:signal transduction histidine kinase